MGLGGIQAVGCRICQTENESSKSTPQVQLWRISRRWRGVCAVEDDNLSQNVFDGDWTVNARVFADFIVIAQDVDVAVGDFVFAGLKADRAGDVERVDGVTGEASNALDDGLGGILGVGSDDDILASELSDQPVGVSEEEPLAGFKGGFHGIAANDDGVELALEEDGKSQEEEEEDTESGENEFLFPRASFHGG